MTTLPRALEILNGINYTCLPFIAQWQNIFYRTSIHTTGACPRFYPLRDDGYGLSESYYTPSGWINANYDTIFSTHMLNKHPRESQVIRELRKSWYRPYQMAPLLESIGSTAATIFGESKWTLSVENKEDNDYIYGNNFEGKTLVGYFEHMFKAICEDPNSLFIVVPKEAGYLTETKKIEPKIVHIPSRDIIYISEKEIIYREWDSPYAWFINDIGYWRFEKQEGQRDYALMDGQYGYYMHLFHEKPAHFAGGIWNTQKFYDSYIKAALAPCDDFVGAWSDLQMINKEASHPYIVETDMDCPTCNGNKQKTFCYSCNVIADSCNCNEEDRKWLMADCTSCHGSGQISRNPSEHTIVPKEDMDRDIIKIYEFNVNANKFLLEHAEGIEVRIRKALYNYHIEEAQSGVAKDIDRASTFLYRQMVSNGVWGLIEKCLIDILSLRNTSNSGGKIRPDVPKYILVKPTDFDLKTENDLLEEYKESTDAKTPEWVRQRQIEQYVDKVFGGDDVMVRMASLINQMDAFSVTSITDKTALLSSGGISRRDFQFSNELPKMLKQVVRENGSDWFATAPYNDINTKVTTIFATMPPLEDPAKESTEVKVNV